MKVKSLSRVRLLVTPWTAAYQAPPSMGFSRQEYWSGVPLPSLQGHHTSFSNQCYFSDPSIHLGSIDILGKTLLVRMNEHLYQQLRTQAMRSQVIIGKAWLWCPWRIKMSWINGASLLWKAGQLWKAGGAKYHHPLHLPGNRCDYRSV